MMNGMIAELGSEVMGAATGSAGVAGATGASTDGAGVSGRTGAGGLK